MSPLSGPFTVNETYLCAANASTPAGSLVLMSTHVYPGDNYHASLQSLAEQSATTFADKHVVIAGDFNAARHFDTVYGGNRHGVSFMEAITTFADPLAPVLDDGHQRSACHSS